MLEVEGGRTLRATLKKAGVNLGDLKAVHKQSATVAASAARSKVPTVGGGLGRTIRAAGTKTAGIVRAGNNSRVPYAQVVHWGWPRRSRPAQPFITEGAQSSESTWIRVYENYVAQTIAQIKGK